MTTLRTFAAKTLELSGLVTVGVALVIGLRHQDMARELLWLGIGALTFSVGYLLEPRAE